MMSNALSGCLDSYRERCGKEEGDDFDGSGVLVLVGKLIDGYLSEIASDSNLKPEKFCNLAMSLPEQARLFDDVKSRGYLYQGAFLDIGDGEGEDLRSNGLRETDDGGVHARCSERASSLACSGYPWISRDNLCSESKGGLLISQLPCNV